MKDVTILNENGIDVNHGLELLGDMEMYDETLQDFITESETRIPQIQTYKETGDMPNYAILVHAMKSDSKYLGFTTLAELSYNHEMESKASNVEYINAHFEELMKEAARVIAIAKTYLGE